MYLSQNILVLRKPLSEFKTVTGINPISILGISNRDRCLFLILVAFIIDFLRSLQVKRLAESRLY
jgi:hypothetical protein